MQAFTPVDGIAAPFLVPDVDTDKLIPHRFLRKPLSAGYRNFLFHELRFDAQGAPVAGFLLHREPYTRAQVLVAGRNFGCGSAREAAVYALMDFGFRAVIAASFADVFRANCLQAGLLPVELDADTVAGLCAQLERAPGAHVRIDLQEQVATFPDGARHRFEIDATRKVQLLEGLDDIGMTLKGEAELKRFEDEYHARLPWTVAAVAA